VLACSIIILRNVEQQVRNLSRRRPLPGRCPCTPERHLEHLHHRRLLTWRERLQSGVEHLLPDWSRSIDPRLHPPHHVHVAAEGLVCRHEPGDKLHEHNAHAVDIALLGRLQGVRTLCTKCNNRMVGNKHILPLSENKNCGFQGLRGGYLEQCTRTILQSRKLIRCNPCRSRPAASRQRPSRGRSRRGVLPCRRRGGRCWT
jgi:hypothetical protein